MYQKISSIVVSSQHLESANNDEIRKKILEIIEEAIPNVILPSREKNFNKSNWKICNWWS